MSQRITIDPVTRIEGHLRIDCEIENGVVSKAWASGIWGDLYRKYRINFHLKNKI